MDQHPSQTERSYHLSHNFWWYYMKYKKRLLLRCLHHFYSDLINNMDHMRISGTEPSSVILGQAM